MSTSDDAVPDTLVQSTDDVRRAQQRSPERTRPPLAVPGYDADRFLGAGAYGEVWVATERNTRRRVAVKFYTHRGGLDWSLLSREVEKLAFLFADRYVVQLIDAGWDADPPYYIMEYLENGSLADRIRQGPIEVNEAVSMFRDVAIGLVHAHGKGVLHCDLKPGNVLLDQDMKPRLADFGQSRLSHEQKPALGTLFYMAPEQADLKVTPDARWDVYALGALIYCMLTGEPPYRNDSAATLIRQGSGLADQLERYVRLLNQSPKPIGHRAVPGVDRALAEIVDRCLAINPARRYPNPQAVVAALESRQMQRTRRPLLVLGAVGPALLLSVIALFTWSLSSTAVHDSEASLTARALESNRFAARFVAEAVASQVTRRWDALESVAGDDEIVELVRAAQGKPPQTPERKATQARLEGVQREHPELNVLSWFAVDANGQRLGRSPADPKTDADNYRYRDYFHGLGRNLEASDPLAKTVKPIERPHRSQVIQSTSGGTRVIVFTVPIWDTAATAPSVIGVLGLSVELGKFAELRAEESTSRQRIAVLVDTREDAHGRRGAVLEHPAIAEASGSEWYVDTAYLTPFIASDVAPHGVNMDDYHDPTESAGETRWLAAVEPVTLAGRTRVNRDLGWLVLVQERFDEAVRPARQLGERLTRTGLWALAFFLGVVTALWGFVVFVLNERPRFRWSRLLRRRTGLAPASLASGMGTASPTGKSESSRSSSTRGV